MPREIFGQVANPGPRLGSRSMFTLPVSIALHAVLVAAMVIVPLMASDVLPRPRVVIAAFTPESSAPPPPPPPAGPPASSVKATSVAALTAPSTAPVAIEPEPVTTTGIISDGVGVAGGLSDGAVGGVGVITDLPRVPTAAQPSRPLPIGGRIKEPAKLRHVPPVYPMIAQQARVEGVVVIEAIIGVDGRVKEARVLVSKPLLDAAALDAVRQWVFTPTTLNGVPVPVIMTVTVNFRIN